MRRSSDSDVGTGGVLDGDHGSDWWGHVRRLKPWRAPLLAILAVALSLFTYSGASALMAGMGLTWSVWISEPVKLVVCWENPGYAEPFQGESDPSTGAQRREWVRLALKRTWEREARVLFVGWQQCQDEGNATAPPHTLGPRRPGTADENIKIEVRSSGGGQNPGHGSWGDYQQGGVWLNLHFGSQASYESLAIHEFGHVLGFYHEEERVDWPDNIPGCPPQHWTFTDPPWWPIPTEQRWGAIDRHSVMAYCSNGPNELSLGDVAGVQRIYMRHIPGTLLSLPGSLCLSDFGGGANGVNAFGWACDEALDDQEWHYQPSTGALYIAAPSTPGTHRCLDVDTLNYSEVQIWDCLGGSNQQWRFQRTEIRGYGGMCLTRSPLGIGSLMMRTCTGAATQLWRVEPSEYPGAVRFRSDTGNLCLTRDGAAGSDALATPCTTFSSFLPLVLRASSLQGGTAAQAGAAGGSSAVAESGLRDFVLTPGGILKSPGFFSDDLCLDVQDVSDDDYVAGLGGPVPGQRAQFFGCLPAQLNQRWGLSGDVVSGNKCLTLAGSAVNNGAAALVGTCDGSLKQDWDYHW